MEIEITTYRAIDALDLEKALTAALDAMASYGSHGEEIHNLAKLLVLAKIERARHFAKHEKEISSANIGKE